MGGGGNAGQHQPPPHPLQQQQRVGMLVREPRGGGGASEVNNELRGERGVAGGKPGTTGRWYHDMYNEDDQTPKSRQELIAYYGYDPRTREEPPPITQIR